MLYFSRDYQESGHEAIFRRFLETKGEHLPPYGTDHYCLSAAEKIRSACADPAAEVRFLTGGTQTNQLVIDALLSPWEGVVAAETGHIGTHEAGAIEWTGHKVMTLPSHDGKLDAEELRAFVKTCRDDENREHMTDPGMVYISHPTEYGTLYTRSELSSLSRVCREYHLPLYVDGARLAYGLAAPGTDVTLPVLAEETDAFYIGGTKCGALIGEALVFPRGKLPERFLSRTKQHGALLAKGWAAGLQFDVLFTDGLYLKLGAHAVELALRLKAGLLERGFELRIDSPTNQQFLVADDALLSRLEGKADYAFWERLDDGRTVIRFATSWATEPEEVDALLELLNDL